MLKGVGILVLILFLVFDVSASCNETQIDINTANLTELQKITQIGPARAQQIISLRPFYSVNDLSRVGGIGNGSRLGNITAQGLACVNESNVGQPPKENISTNNNQQATEANNTSTKTIKSNNIYSPPEKNKTETINLTPISLNSKDIKSEEDKEILKKNLALGGVITFCIGFGALFLVKFARRRKENEFG